MLAQIVEPLVQGVHGVVAHVGLAAERGAQVVLPPVTAEARRRAQPLAPAQRDEASSDAVDQRPRDEAELLVGAARTERGGCSWVQQRRRQRHRGAQQVHQSSVAALALLGVVRSGASVPSLIGGGLIGALAVIGWVGTGFVLQDDFDPIAMESLSFTSPWSETLFWTIASSAIPAGFGTGLVGGVLAGAGVTALLRGQAAWTSFDSPAQTGRYLLGAGMMGFGGVLAGGCTVGAGLSGVPTLSVAALLALISIVAGGRLAATVLRPAGAKGPIAAVPAE